MRDFFLRLIKFKAAVILIAVLVVGFAVYAIFTEVVRLRPVIEIEERVTIDTEFLEYSVRQIAELSTLVYSYTHIGIFEDQAVIEILGWELAIPGTRRFVVSRFDGSIRMGIDVSQVSVSVDEDAYEVTVSLPRVGIQTHAIDLDSIEVLNEHSGLFVRFDLQLYAGILSQWQQEVENRGHVNLFLEQAQDNAEEVLRVLLLSTLPEEYTVNFIWR